MSHNKFSSAQGAPSKDGPGDISKDAPAANQLATQPDKTLVEEMAKYGITQVPVDYFHYGVFRYTNLKHAVAQAKRSVQRAPPLSVIADDTGSG